MESNPPEVPVVFEGAKKWITGLTPKTTCDDVIHSLLINAGCPIPHEAVRNFALFENWRGIERTLKGRSRFMKLVRDWGDEAARVEISMRRVDSTVREGAVYGSLSRRKNRIKDWFKTKESSKKDKKSLAAARSLQTLPQQREEAPYSVHDESSILAQGKDNMFCALSCYKRRQARGQRSGGLRERNMNVPAPFERPRSVAIVSPHTSGLLEDPIYPLPSDTYPAQQTSRSSLQQQSMQRQYSVSQVSHYGSRTSLKQTVVTRHRSCYYDDGTDVENTDPAAIGALREPYYSEPQNEPVKRAQPQNVHDWDYDYQRPGGAAIVTDCDDNGDSDSDAESVRSCRELTVARRDGSQHSYASSTQDYNDSRFKSLLNLVLSQERKIQEQFSLIQEADKRIEHYELAMHRLRSSQQGRDYVQDTYLSGDSTPSVSPAACHRSELGSMCSKVSEMDSILQKQYQKLHDLSLQLDSETKQLRQSHDPDGNNTTQAEGPFESTRLSPIAKCGDANIQSEIATLRSDLQRSISLSLQQQSELKSLDRNMHQYRADMQQRQEQYSELMQQLSPQQHSISTSNITSNNVTSAFTRCHGNERQMMTSVTSSSVSSYAHAPRAITRQLKSMSDLQAPLTTTCTTTMTSSYQQSMRRSISDLRETLQRYNPASQKYSDEDIGTYTGKQRVMLPMLPIEPVEAVQNAYSEMGIDIGGRSAASKSRDSKPPISKQRNETDDTKKRQHGDVTVGSLNSEVQRILSRRVGALTPIKESELTHTLIEYHNETVDLDALMRKPGGRAPNPSKMFEEKQGFTPIDCHAGTQANAAGSEGQARSFATVIYDAASDAEKELPRRQCEPIASAYDFSTVADISLSSEPESLPPLGLETMSTMAGRRFMPALLEDSLSRDTLELSTATNQPGENTSLWGTPTAVNHTYKAGDKTHNNTSVWCTQMTAPDGTFVVPEIPAKQSPQIVAQNSINVSSIEQDDCEELNPPYSYDETSTDLTLSTDCNVSYGASTAASAHVIRQTIAASLSAKAPRCDVTSPLPSPPTQIPSPLASDASDRSSVVGDMSSVKKRLFSDDYADDTCSDDTLTELAVTNATYTHTKMAALAEAEDTNLESMLTSQSAVSESGESGVGSLSAASDDSHLNASDSSHCKPAYPETAV